MRTQFVVSALLILSFSVTAFATSPASSSTVNWQKAEQNYKASLYSENVGVRASAAGFIGEYRLKGATQDLITILHTDKVERNRMAAAKALVRIGDRDAIDAVKEAVIYDGSATVAQYCKRLLESTQSTNDMSLKN
ncbi:MAG: HEAT repeat domain-containing protein [Bacteroidota bacterium]